MAGGFRLTFYMHLAKSLSSVTREWNLWLDVLFSPLSLFYDLIGARRARGVSAGCEAVATEFDPMIRLTAKMIGQQIFGAASSCLLCIH